VTHMVYDWCTSLLTNMKSQLTDCKQGRKRNFGFASILCSFFFERVPGLSPRVEIIPQDRMIQTMSRWTDVMRWLGGGRVPTPYNDELFFWWRRQVIAIDDYPYVGIDYRGDPDMPRPLGSAYSDIGIIFFFFYISFFLCFLKRIKKCKYFYMVSSINNGLSCRCRFALTRRIPMTSTEELGR
jgi:hypothetical protein